MKYAVDVDYQALLIKASALAKSHLYSLEQAVGGVGRSVNANKTRFLCFKQDGVLSTLSGKHLKLVDQSYTSAVISSGGARGVVVIVVGIGHGDTSSNPGRD